MTISVNPEDRFWKDSPDNNKEPSRFSGLLRYLLVFLVLLGLGIGGWKLLQSFLHRRPSLGLDELPLIKADETPYKVKPEDQSVPGIHHQDKLIYDRLGNPQNAGDAPPVEHILPEPETPAVIQMTEQYAPRDVDLGGPPLTSLSLPSAPSAPVVESIADLIGEESPPPTTETTPPPAGNIFIQLGSLKSYELAETEWARLRTKQRELLGKREPVIQRVDLGEEQGTYYRLRTGPFDSVESAKKTCTALGEEKVSCFVVKSN